MEGGKKVKPIKKKIRKNVYINEELANWIAEQSNITGISQTTIMHLAIQEYKNLRTALIEKK
jgi:hypothetical protein